MNNEAKKKSNKPSSNYKESIPEDKVPAGDKAVKKTEDKVYQEKEANFKNPAKKRETEEQPVHPIKKAPDKA